MSRYIDATELNGYKFGLISPYAQKLFHQTINNAPTADVIPVEWIKGYIEDNVYSGEIELMLDMWRKDHE